MTEANLIELRIEKIIAGGDGLGRREGQVFFVSGSAPGDLLLVEPVESRRDYVRARIRQILEDSPERREPPCPYYSDCGGCSLMHLRPEAQIGAKFQIVQESLRRGGGLDFEDTVWGRHGPELGYRTRARLHVKLTRSGVVLGFRERGSHRVVDVSHCVQLSPGANRSLEGIRDWLAARAARGLGLSAVELMEPVGTAEPGRAIAHFVVQRGWHCDRAELDELRSRAALAGLLVTEQRGKGATVLWRLGQLSTRHSVAGMDYQVDVGSFFQANRFLLEALVEEVVSESSPPMGLAVDLYCGVGLFTLPLARRAARVIGVESSFSAVADARANAERAGLDHVTFVHKEAGDYASGEGLKHVDCLVVDPPREGLDPQVVEAISRDKPQEIRYVSCDSATFGRDAGRLAGQGMVLRRLVLLDLFPNTHHFEIVATFRPARRSEDESQARSTGVPDMDRP